MNVPKMTSFAKEIVKPFSARMRERSFPENSGEKRDWSRLVTGSTTKVQRLLQTYNSLCDEHEGAVTEL